MTQTKQQCSTPDQLFSFLRGQLSAREEADLQHHLDDCVSCRERLESTAADASVWKEAREFFASGALHNSLKDSREDYEETNQGSQRIRQVLDSLGPTDDPESLGRIGGYEVTGVVGAGGMGVVLKAHDRSLDRIVAIKVISPHLASSGSARKRFAREAKAAAAVLHPNVIAIHSVASEEACPFLVMPYVRGASLQKRIDSQGPLPLKDTLRIGAQIAAGLAAAHEQGLVHRDIKPANVLLEEGVERVTITDFGLALAVDDASMTCSGVIAGTPQYMSPEQARGEPIDARSDLFSLGGVLYAMCTGRSPFRAETTYGVLHRIANDKPTPVCEVNSDVPVWLDHLIQLLMAKRTEDRFDSAAQVAELLEGCLAHVQRPAAMPLPDAVSALSPSKPRRPPIGKFIAAAAFVFAFFFAGVLIVLELNKGTLTITSDVDGVPIRIKQGVRIVKELSVSKAGAVTRIAAGHYVVEVIGEFTDMSVDSSVVLLRRGETEIVKVVKNAKSETVSLGTGNSVVSGQPTQRVALDREIGTAESSETAQVVFKGPTGLLVETIPELPLPQANSLTSFVDHGPCPSRWNFSTSSHLYRRLNLTRIPGRDELRVQPILLLSPAIEATRSWLEENAIPIEFTTEDFDQVLLGKLVTKVIYLPRPEFRRQANAGIETLVSTQLLPDTTPIQEAEQRGDVIAVLQIEDYDKLATATCKGMPLEEAVRNLNAKLSRQPRFSKQPPLTVDEVVAWARWNLSLLKDQKYKDYRYHYQKLVDDRVLDGGSFHADVVNYTEPMLSVCTFQIGMSYTLPLFAMEGDVQYFIRRRFIKAEVANEASTLFTNGKPLTDSISEFNQLCKEKDPNQPPLTEDEVLAALRNMQFEKWIDKPANMFDELSAVIGKILSDRALPESVKLVLNTDFQAADGTKFRIWRPSIRISTSDMPEPRTIPLRTHFISSSD